MYNFHLDRISSTEVAGWIADANDFDRRLAVHFFIDGVAVGTARADIIRADVEKAGRGPRQCGFSWSVPAAVARLAIDGGKTVEVVVLDGGAKAILTRFTLHNDPSLTGSVRTGIRLPLDQAIIAASIAALEEGGTPIDRHDPARYELHDHLFAPAAATEADFVLSPYVMYTHERLRRDVHNPLDGSVASSADFLRWYLEGYGLQRRPYRVPLGASEIAFLNAPLQMVGMPYRISRASMSYALSETDHALLPIRDREEYVGFVSWWATEKAPSLHLEDCLVPDYYVEALRRMNVHWMGQLFAPSCFMEERFKSDPRFHGLNLGIEADRIIYLVWYLLEAVDRPGLIRFVPPKSLSALFAREPGQEMTLFDRVVQSVHESGAGIGELFSADSFNDLLWRRGFDLGRRRFIFTDAAGNRFESARFRPLNLPGAPQVPLQVIGPFEKSSGLGQAARLSAETIRRAGYGSNNVNFGMDNPAPVNMGGLPVTFGKPKPARVNLIHLNGETIPLALAYMPDVFNGAYNIGYFFWELSTPAPSQRLALDLLDEIWVATDYGVSIYQPHVSIPVHNVGMAVDPIEVPDWASSRAFLAERLPLGPNTFVFFAAFDSFSFLERKNPHGLVDAFRAAFGEDEDVRLVLKTHNRDFVMDAHQTMRWERIVEIAARDRRIVIINETLQFSDLMRLKKGADAYVSLHRSEGWGMGMVEAMQLGVPVVATGYSGNVDFTTPETAFLVDYTLIEPGPNEYLFVDRGQVWAAPLMESAVAQLRAVRSDAAGRQRKVAAARDLIDREYSFEAQAVKYKARLDAIFAKLGPASNA
jgi:glycosyltransferase involved in cell wall biosynthesis